VLNVDSLEAAEVLELLLLVSGLLGCWTGLE
jgi:hypothetical protein